MTPPFTGADVAATRKIKKWSRRNLCELTGLTQAKLGNIEKGRVMRPEEIEALLPHVIPGAGGDQPSGASAEANGAANDAPGSSSASTSPPPPPAPGPEQPIVIPTEDEFDEHEGVVVTDEDPTPAPAPEPERPSVDPPKISDEMSQVDEEAQSAHDRISAFGGRLFANSELRTYKRCKRKWWFAYYRKLGLKHEQPVGARQLGTIVHACLAAYYSREQVHPLDTLDTIVKEDLERIDPANHIMLEDYRKQTELAKIMLEGYLEWLAETGEDSTLEIIAPETTLIAPFPDDTFPNLVGLIGKIDLRVRRVQDGARLFLDHKTVGDLTTPTQRLHMDEQMLQYHLLEMLDLASRDQLEASERTDGGLYNMLRKVKRTVRANPPFYGRVEVRHNPEMIRSYWTRVIGQIFDIFDTEAKLNAGWDHRMAAPPNPTRDCTWDCDFFHVCPMTDDGSRVDDFIADHYVEISPLRRYEKKEDVTA